MNDPEKWIDVDGAGGDGRGRAGRDDGAMVLREKWDQRSTMARRIMMEVARSMIRCGIRASYQAASFLRHLQVLNGCLQDSG